jgi:hypothetical protein
VQLRDFCLNSFSSWRPTGEQGGGTMSARRATAYLAGTVRSNTVITDM